MLPRKNREGLLNANFNAEFALSPHWIRFNANSNAEHLSWMNIKSDIGWLLMAIPHE